MKRSLGRSSGTGQRNLPIRYAAAQTIVRSKLRRGLRSVPVYAKHHPLASTCIAVCLFVILIPTYRYAVGSSRIETPDPDTNIWLVGVSKVDITPRERVWLSGFSSRNRTADTTTPLDPSLPLYARALSLRPRISHPQTSTPASPLVIVALDLIGIDRAFSDVVHTAARGKYGLRREQLHLIPSHTHSGPVVARNLAPLVPDDEAEWAKIVRYADHLLERIVDVIGAALAEERLVPTAGRFARGEAHLAVNRRQVREADYDGSRRGDTDDVVPVMWFTRASGVVVTGLYGYAAHATVMTGTFRYSGDYPGLASAALERQFPGSVWLFLPGCGGDQNVYPRGSEALAKRHAMTLAGVVSGIVSASDSPIALLRPAALTLRTDHIALPFEKTLSRKDLRQLQRSPRAADRHAVAGLLRGLNDEGRTPDSCEYPVSTVRLGAMRVAFLGGEPTVGFCHRLRALGAGWVVGYTDDVMGYVATDKAREEGGREGSARAALYYGLPAAWKFGAEKAIVDAVRELMDGT